MRRSRWTVIVGILVLLLAGGYGAGAMEALSLNRFEDPGSESVAAREALARDHRTGPPNLALLVTAHQGTVDGPDVAAAGGALTREVAAQPGVADAWSYWSRQSATLASDDKSRALVLAWIPGDADEVRRDLLPGLAERFTRDDGVIRVEVGGSDEVFRTVMQTARQDFIRAELVALPMIFLLLWLVYRRLSAALVTLGVGVFAVLGSLALIRLVTGFTEVSTFAANIALVLGIGLGVDYGLFIIFRYREEFPAGGDVVRRTMRTAGRAVLFSGVTVAASLAALFAFPFPFLRSFAYAGLAVVLCALVAATVLLPAALTLLGSRVLRKSTPKPTFWYPLARRVLRRPLLFGGAALAVVLLLGAPFLGVRFGAPDDRILPASAPVRQVYDQIRENFAQEEADAILVVAPAGVSGDYAERLSTIDGVIRVDTSDRGGPGAWLSVVTASDVDAAGLVRAVREVPAPFPTLVGGYPAELVDYRDAVTDRLPLVVGLIVALTFVVLFVLTRSVVAPVKAAVLNLLSLSVMFGALVFLFQDGNLGFEATGTLEPSIPILMFCVAYGLSMDYEVFLLSRIREDYDRTGDPVGSIATGIRDSAPLVTAAALILAASFATYATGRVVFLQQLGIGMALAILVDATLIRGILVPAFMRLAGRANWWAPAFLSRRAGAPAGTGNS